MLDNTAINIFLIIPAIILYQVLFIKYLWISKILLLSVGFKTVEKISTTPFDPAFFSYSKLKNFLKHYLNTVRNLSFLSLLL